MANVNVKILFSVEGLAGIQTARQEVQGVREETAAIPSIEIDTKPAATSLASLYGTLSDLEKKYEEVDVSSPQFKELGSQIQEVRGKIDNATASTGAFAGRSGTARMAVISFSQGLQDASMFQQSFRMGMMGISNNVDMVIQSLTMLSEESKRTGTSMSSSLLNVLKGPSGILVAVSLLITVLQVLPGLFSNTSKAAKEASDEGLKSFADWAKNASQGQQEKWKAYADQRVKEIQADLDLLNKAQTWSGYSGTTGQSQDWQGYSQSSKMLSDSEKARLQYLQEQIAANPKLTDQLKAQSDKYSEISKTLSGVIEGSKAHNDTLKTEGELLDASGNKYQQLQHQLDILQDKQKQGITIDENGKRVADEIRNVRKELEQYTSSTVDLDKLNLDQLKKKQEYEEALLTDHKGSLSDLEKILTAELKLTTNAKDRYDIEKQIADIKKAESAGPVTAVAPLVQAPKRATAEPLNTLGQVGPIASAESIAGQEEIISQMQTRLAGEVSEAKRQELRQQIQDHQGALARMQMDDKSYKDYVVQTWMDQNAAAASALSGINAGVVEFGNQFLAIHRQAKNGWDAVWISMYNSAINYLVQLLANEAVYAAASLAIHSGAETAKTTETVVGATARSAAVTAETGVETTNALTKILNAVASAIEWEVATFGPFALFTVPASIAGIYAAFAGAKSMLGLAVGTKVTEEQIARIGEVPEFIMPERTFYDVAQQEIIPKVLQIAYSQAGAMAGGSASGSNNALLDEMKKFNENIRNLKLTADTRELKIALDGVDRIDAVHRF